MLRSFRLLFGLVFRLFHSQRNLLLENLALRQQLLTLKRKQRRPRLNRFDRMFWVMIKRTWSRWKDVLVIVKPETVVGWHRAGFRLYWRWRSQPRGGRPKITQEIRVLIRRLAERESGLGSAQDSWRVVKVGPRRMRTQCGPVSRTTAAAWRPE